MKDMTIYWTNPLQTFAVMFIVITKTLLMEDGFEIVSLSGPTMAKNGCMFIDQAM